MQLCTVIDKINSSEYQPINQLTHNVIYQTDQGTSLTPGNTRISREGILIGFLGRPPSEEPRTPLDKSTIIKENR